MLAPREFKLVWADDDDLFRAAVHLMLRHAGVEVYPCSDGVQAVKLCESLRPDAALFDLDMPHLDGFEAARRLRMNPALLGMRLVAITGRASLDFRMRAVDSSFDQFLCKPVPLTALLQALHMAGPNSAALTQRIVRQQRLP
ncbi:MAG TPA: response regulator [Rhodanobacteraceae bacterium]|jgi:CheY-like chemotaxis protein|nr:response regulator [Rhodanobacteraceae bacterium]